MAAGFLSRLSNLPDLAAEPFGFDARYWPQRAEMMLFSCAIRALLTASLMAAQDSQDSQDVQSFQNERAMTNEIQRLRPGLAASEIARIVRGFQIAPVRLDLRRQDFVFVGLGSDLVNAAGGCNDCHTNPPYAPGGDPVMGEPKRVNAKNYLASGTTFGPFTSRNLMPDPTTGRPANLTYDQFRESIRTGVDQKHLHPQISPLLQVMPWPVS